MENTPKTHYAICILREDCNSGVSGVVHFIMPEGGKTRIVANLTGLTEGDHGFHVHEFGNLTEGCKSAGGHYNPHGKEHGGPFDEERHVGDMGNVPADAAGVGKLDYEDPVIELTGEFSIIGRAVVTHADPDDLGRGGFADSKITGHAGARVACGTIGISAPFEI